MNLKALMPVAAIASVAAIEMTVISPAQAVNLSSGSFQLDSNNGSSISNFVDNDNPFTLNFNAGTFNVNNGLSQGVFSSLTAGAGDINITALELAPNLNGSFSVTNPATNPGGRNGYINFISGLILNGEEVFVDILTSTEFNGFVNSASSYSLVAVLEHSIVRDSNNSVFGTVLPSSLHVGPNAQQDSILVATAVPTPALLPGFVGMGIAALRKKQGVKSKEA